MVAPTRRYSTGLRFLDSRLNGGVPAGTLLALTAPASSQSQLLLYRLATARPTLYVSMTCPDEAELRSALDGAGVAGQVDLVFEHAPPSDLMADPGQYLGRLSPESFLVVDGVDDLERANRDRYLAFLNGLKRRMRETDSVGVLHGIDTDPVPAGRRLTLRRADHVWQLDQRILSTEIKTRLLVTKARGDRALTEPIPLIMTDRIRVDTSRRIA